MDSFNVDDFSQAKPLDLSGVRILVVEDSWQIGIALKRLLELFGAVVSGPVATAADADRVASEEAPDAAVVDFSLRGGERATALLDRLHDRGVYIIVMTGYPVLPTPLRHAAAILQKPFSETQLLGSLCQVVARKAQQELRQFGRT